MTTMLKPRKRQPHICARCGSQDIRVQHVSDTVDFKGLTVEVAGLADTVCNSCGLTWVTEGQEQDNLALLREAFAHKRDAVREREGLLTGEQIEFVLSQLGLSKVDAASFFGGGPNAFSKYVSGDVLQSFPMDRLLRLTLAFGSHAVKYLRQGRDAPLALNAGGYFVAPLVSCSATQLIFESPITDHTNLRIVPTSPSEVETLQG